MSNFKKISNSEKIKSIAIKHGFDECGISKSGFLEEEADRLENWLKSNCHGEMHYMENWFDKRLDTRKLVQDSKSVISVLLNYYPEKFQRNDTYKISKYAYGKDYHKVVKKKLKAMFEEIKSSFGDVHGRIFVDSAPVMDRVWAKKSGLGWIGKHTLLINKKAGSYFFIGHIICDLELEEDHPIPDFCGDCTRCIDACPTNAISHEYWIDAKNCISYLTIELKNSIPKEFKQNMNEWIFGCDICQDVCPWNRFATEHNIDALKPLDSLINYSKENWQKLDKEKFDEIFAGSAVKRTKFEGLKRNIEFIQKS